MPITKQVNHYSHLCQDCGSELLALPENSKRKQRSLSTWYEGKCDRCKKKKVITECRDFGYPLEVIK
jgi:hypothetical protein